MTFFPCFFRIVFRPPKILPRCPRGAQRRPNDPQNDPKSVPEAPQNRYFRINEKSQKPLFLLWFRHIGSSSFGRLGDQNGDRRADRSTDAQKRRKCRPSGAQGRPKVPKRGPEGEGLLTPFRIIFRGRTMGARPRVPWAPRGVDPWSSRDFSVDWGMIFDVVSSKLPLFSIERFKKSIHPSMNQSINQTIKPSMTQSIHQTIHPSINRSIDRSIAEIARSGHGGGFAAGS